MFRARVMTVAVVAGATVLTLSTAAFADRDSGSVSKQVSKQVQHQRDLVDGKLDPSHLRHKAEKDAQEAAMGLNTTPDAEFKAETIVIGTTAYLVPTGTAVARTATVADANNLCAYGQHCLYYNSGNVGANFHRSDTTSTIRDYAGYTFPTGLAGGGQPVKNNAASVGNASGSYTFGVFYNSGWAGDRAWFAPDEFRNLPDYMKNENASGKSVSAS